MSSALSGNKRSLSAVCSSDSSGAEIIPVVSSNKRLALAMQLDGSTGVTCSMSCDTHVGNRMYVGSEPEDNTVAKSSKSLLQLTFETQMKNLSDRKLKRKQQLDSVESDVESVGDDSVNDEDYVPHSGDESSTDNESDAYLPECQSVKVSSQRVHHYSVPVDGHYPENVHNDASAGIHCSESATVVESTEKYSKKRIPRPCVFCETMQTNLHRHFLLKHKDEAAVKEAMQLPSQDRLEAFAKLRKDGIAKYNKKEMKTEKPTYVCERSRSQGQKLVQCGKCHGYYSKTYFARHRKLCISESADIPQAIPITLLSEYCSDISSAFRKDVLTSFAKDDIGKVCRSDEAVMIFGSRMYSKLSGKQDKKPEVKRSLMADMRRLSHLYKHFKEQCEKVHKISANSSDLLIRSNFEEMKEAVLTYTNSEGTLKAGLKSQLYYLIKRFAKIMKATYLVRDDDEKAGEVDKFVQVLQLHERDLFGDAIYQLNMNRQERLRRPQQLPDEADIGRVKQYTVTRA